MFTRKELTLVLLTALTTTCIVTFAQTTGKPVMGSTTVEWSSLKSQPTKTGAVRRVFESPTATLESLECHITTLNPGESPHPPHRHPEEEIILVKEGTVETLVNGEWKKIGPGSVIFNASNVEHGLRNVGDGPATYHVFMWRSSATPQKEAAK